MDLAPTVSLRKTSKTGDTKTNNTGIEGGGGQFRRVEILDTVYFRKMCLRLERCILEGTTLITEIKVS